MGLSAEKKVGFVFFLGLCILGVFTVLLTDVNLFRKYYTFDVVFDSVGGLELGDSITLGGMEVGEVKNMKLDNGRILVTLAVRTENRIPYGSEFRVADVGMLGGKVVSVTWRQDGGEFIPSGARIEGLPSQGLSDALASLGEAGDKVDEILVSVRSVAEKIDQGQGTVGKLINEDDVYQDAKATIAELRAIVEENRRKIADLLADLKESAPRLKQTLANVEEITAKINQGEGTIGKLINEPDMYDEAQTTLVSVRDATTKLSNFMAKAEMLKVYLGAEANYNVSTQQLLTKAFIQVEPNSSKMYRIAVTMLSGPGTEADVKDDVDYQFDAQIGFRFFDDVLTLRGGLLEGRVGGGIDVRLYQRDIVATLEARDVWTHEKDEHIEPFLMRGYVTAFFLWGFYVRAGVDNILDEPALYCGGGLFIEEQDIITFFGLLTATQ
ncbi:MAG TPA: MlaD family protein [bacterium]|nr:MlaD family protein [bacterium]HPQ65792.1 MlaD family protein [bacterium]